MSVSCSPSFIRVGIAKRKRNKGEATWTWLPQHHTSPHPVHRSKFQEDWQIFCCSWTQAGIFPLSWCLWDIKDTAKISPCTLAKASRRCSCLIGKEYLLLIYAKLGRYNNVVLEWDFKLTVNSRKGLGKLPDLWLLRTAQSFLPIFRTRRLLKSQSFSHFQTVSWNNKY